jgi:bacillithiol synthase
MFLSSAILPETNQLAMDYVLQYDKVGEFFSADYHAPSSYPRLAAAVLRAQHADRPALVALLEEQNQQLQAGERTFEHLALLARQDSLAVVTGQQAGLFGGPLYTLYKALTTCRMARHLTELLGRPVVPVFFLVSEDHDFEEIRWAGLIDQQNQFQKIQYQPSSSFDRIPVSDILLDSSIEAAIDGFDQGTPASEFKNKFLADLRSDYRPGNSMTTAFASWFMRLLKDWGMIFFDPSDGRAKELALPVWKQELLDDLSVRTITDTNARLQSAGYAAQLSIHADRPNLFILDNGRHSLQRHRGEFLNMGNHSSWTAETLLSQPQRLSPKAALRPVFQDFLFPTIAYVAGPGEIAYWAQLKKMYEAFAVPMPIVVPRAAFTLLEPRIQRNLDRFGLTVQEVLSRGGSIREEWRRNNRPQEISRALASLQAVMDREWLSLKNIALGIDPTLKSPAEKTELNLKNILAQFENRIHAALEQKQTQTSGQYKSIEQTILPAGHLQERQLTLLPFLFKYGQDFIRLVAEAIDVHRLEHQVLSLYQKGTP